MQKLIYFVKKYILTHLDGNTGFLARLGVPKLVFGLFRSVQVLLGSVLAGVGSVLGGSLKAMGGYWEV